MMNDSLHLVDNAGELMLVHRMLRCTHIDTYERRWAVYKVDLDAGVLVPAKSLGGRAGGVRGLLPHGFCVGGRL
jgi:hypothetical protein